ncbi:hypothetical protein FOZ63_010767 [Perkinsus olseni]|uniref:Uncharacterized protein n=1 Tax=Perkinsus olseni TaxID=32597 RepID=A0A7J6QI44_PEROL|nr:hypothetical protein FOZ63_010767 [Perkinsus olseni]
MRQKGRRDMTKSRESGDVLVSIPDPPGCRSGGPPEVRVRDESEAACHRSKTKGASRPLGGRSSRTSDPREARDVTTWAVPEQKKCKTESQIMAYELDDGRY